MMSLSSTYPHWWAMLSDIGKGSDEILSQQRVPRSALFATQPDRLHLPLEP